MARKKNKVFTKEEQKKEKGFNTAIVVIILILLGLILYWKSMRGAFIFDDYSTIVDNRDVRTGSIVSDYNKQRYVGFITFAINYSYSGLNTFSYHIVNVVIHIINSILVYILVEKIVLLLTAQARMKYHREVSLITAIIFLIHPIQTQAVSYITQRFTSLAAMFTLISALSYLQFRISKSKAWIYFVISIISCLLAYKTKENTATLPLIICAIEFLLLGMKRNVLKRLAYCIPYVVMIVVIPLSFLQTNKPLGELIGEISRTTYETPLISRTEYLLTQMRVIVSYVRLLILPIKQSVDYIFPLSKSFFEAYTFLSFCFIMLIIFLAIILYKKYPLITFGIVWFLIFLAVESSVIPIIDVIFEHRVYLPSVGFIVAVVYAIYIIDEKLKKKWVIPAIFSIIIIALCIATWHRNMLWGNPVALWKDTVEHFPNNPRALGNLGLALASEKRYSEAVQVLRKAVEVNPRIGNNWYALAVCYKELQLIDDAIKSYRTTLELNPKFQKAAYDLADIYMQQKRYDDAYKLLMDAKKIDEKHPYTNSLLAQYYCEIGEIGVAKLLMSEAEKNGLDLANSFFNIGICMLNHNELFYAQRYFFRTIEFNKDEVESYFFIGVTYDRMNDIDKAVYFYKQYLQQAKLDAEWRQRALMRLQELGR